MESETITLVAFWLCRGSSSRCCEFIKSLFFVLLVANTVPKWFITTKFLDTLVKFIGTLTQFGIFWTPFMLVWPSLIPLANENGRFATTENSLTEIVNRYAPLFALPTSLYHRQS